MHTIMATVDLRMPIFHRIGTKDLEQHLFVCEVVWTAKQVQYEATKIAQIESMFKDHALTWYMKYKGVMIARQNKTLVDIK